MVLISLSELNATTSYGLHPVCGSEFRAEISSGEVYFIANAEDYAPVIVGPYRLAPGGTIADVAIVLPVGFNTAVCVEDEEGRPIEGATVRGWPAWYGSVFLGTLERMAGDDKGLVRAARMIEVPATNEKGLAPATHVSNERYRIEVRAAGYQTTEQAVMPSPERPTVIRLKRARPFVGRVSDSAGEPVSDAEVRLAWRNRFFAGFDLTMWNDRDDQNRVVAKTDESGRFELDRLNNEFVYTLRVDSDRSGSALVENVLAGEEREIAVGREPVDGGTTAGSPEERDQLRPNTITVFGRERKIGDQSACRRVVLTFARNGWPVAPKGAVAIRGNFDGTPIDSYDVYRVSNGAVGLDVPVPGRFACEPGDIVGWYFDTAYPDVEPGKGPLKVTIPVRPAGAVMGRIVAPARYRREGGTVFPSVSVLVKSDDDEYEEIEASIDGECRYFATPIPLGVRCVLKLTYRNYLCVTQRFELDHAEPLREIDLNLPKPVTARARVTYADGRPAANVPVRLHWEHSGEDAEWLSEEFWGAGNTDENGRIAVPNLNPDCPQYYLAVNPTRIWQPTRAKLRTDGVETHIRLKRGRELSVTLLDGKTGRPVPGEVISAHIHPAPETWLRHTYFRAETSTDQDGKCRFSNLPEGTVRLVLPEMHPPKETDWDVDVTREKEVVIRGVEYPWILVGEDEEEVDSGE